MQTVIDCATRAIPLPCRNTNDGVCQHVGIDQRSVIETPTGGSWSKCVQSRVSECSARVVAKFGLRFIRVGEASHPRRFPRCRDQTSLGVQGASTARRNRFAELSGDDTATIKVANPGPSSTAEESLQRGFRPWTHPP